MTTKTPTILSADEGTKAVAVRRVPGHGLSKYSFDVWRPNGRCVCGNPACPNNADPDAGLPEAR